MTFKRIHIALFFLILFTCIKLLSLHTYTHSEENHSDDCEICEYIIVLNDVPFIEGQVFEIDDQIQYNYCGQTCEYSYQHRKTPLKVTLLSRPPPYGCVTYSI